MKNVLTKSLYTLRFIFKTIQVKFTFHKKFSEIFMKGKFIKIKLTRSEEREYRQYWSRVSKHFSLKTIEISKSLSGKFDKRIVPEELFELHIQPKLKGSTNQSFQSNKNIYNKWFGPGIFPRDYLHIIDNAYYDVDFMGINDVSKYISDLHIDFPVILKPSIDTRGGQNILVLNSKNEIIDCLDKFPNAVLQEKLIAFNVFQDITGNGFCTVRVNLFRKISSFQLEVLNTSLRMGRNGGLDNESAGGLVCYINKNGSFNYYAVDKYGEKYLSHPDSGYDFEGKVLSEYDQLIEKSISIGSKVLYTNLMGLDMFLDENGIWRCIEVNLKYQSIRFSQYAGIPFFGENTDEVISELFEN